MKDLKEKLRKATELARKAFGVLKKYWGTLRYVILAGLATYLGIKLVQEWRKTDYKIKDDHTLSVKVRDEWKQYTLPDSVRADEITGVSVTTVTEDVAVEVNHEKIILPSVSAPAVNATLDL